MPRQESVSRADTTEPTLTSGVAVGTVECPPPDRAAGSNGIDNGHLPEAWRGIIAVLRAAMLSILSVANRAARTDWSRISSARTRFRHVVRRTHRFLRRSKLL